MRSFLFASIVILLSSCGVNKTLVRTEKTSVRVVTHTETIPIVLSVDLPEIKEAVVTKDSMSHLENKYAKSDARINRDGTLSHSLETITQKITKESEKEIEYRDSIIEKEVQIPYAVERKLNWWQSFRLRTYWLLLAVIVFIFRKGIISMIKTLFLP